MDNQHRKIHGYRELDQATIDGMNDVKEVERIFLEVIQKNQDRLDADPRWTAIAKTAIEKAAMFAGRAVARPDGYPERRGTDSVKGYARTVDDVENDPHHNLPED